MKIALAAHTILYLPLYVIRERKLLDVDFILEAVGGDQNAYDRVHRGEFDICVCDPMVLAEPVLSHGEQHKPKGKAVAALLNCTGLWAVQGPNLSFNVNTEDDATLLTRIDPVQGQKVSEIVTYDTASTGGRVIRHLQVSDFKPLEGTELKTVPFGKELEELKCQETEVVVTCDLVGALAVEMKDIETKFERKKRPKIIQNFATTTEFQDVLFTVIIVNTKYLETHPKLVTRFVEAIQNVLTEFYDPKSKLTEFAHIMARQEEEAFPVVGLKPGKLLCVTEEELVKLCKKALTKMREQCVLAKSVRLRKNPLLQAVKIWGLYKKLNHKVFFKNCCDVRISERALSASRPLRTLGRKMLAITRPAILLWNSCIAVATYSSLTQVKITTLKDLVNLTAYSMILWVLLMLICFLFVGFNDPRDM